jgi:transcriptional regulator with XRE-family HTH domain
MATNLSMQIKEKITEKGLSTHALEKRAGLKPSAVQNILYGRSKNPSVTIVKAIAKALDCSVSDLLGEEADNVPKASLKFDPSFATKNIISQEWDQDLYLRCFQELNVLLEKERVFLSKGKILELAEEIYEYSQGNSLSVPDQYFAKWLVEKNK